MFAEIAGDDADDLIVLHDALDFGHCHLALGVPMGGRYANIDSLEQLKVRGSRVAVRRARRSETTLGNVLLAVPFMHTTQLIMIQVSHWIN